MEVSRTDIEKINRDLDAIRSEVDAMKYEQAPKRKRKKTTKMLDWERSNDELVKFIQLNRRLPVVRDEGPFESQLAYWLQTTSDLESRDALSQEQRQMFLYTKGFVDGVSLLLSFPFIEDESYIDGLFQALSEDAQQVNGDVVATSEASGEIRTNGELGTKTDAYQDFDLYPVLCDIAVACNVETR